MHVASAHVVRGQRVEAAACRPAHGHVGNDGGAAAQRVHRVAQQPRVKRAPAAMEVREAIDGESLFGQKTRSVRASYALASFLCLRV